MEQNSTWARILSKNYSIKKLLDTEAQSGHRASFIRKGITWSRDLYQKGIGKVVRSRRNTLFWTDKQAEGIKLKDEAIQDLPPHILSLKVSDYWGEGTSWKWSEFSKYLPSRMLLKIASFIISELEEDFDQLGWLPSSQGLFNVKSVHSLEACRLHNSGWRGWKAIWRLRIQERAKDFMWELSHGRILTNVARWMRELAVHGACSRCAMHEEVYIHLVRDCKESKQVWLHLDPPHFYQHFFSLSTQEWLEYNLMSPEMRKIDRNWPKKVASCCWNKWKWRNETIFNNNSIPKDPRLEILASKYKEQELIWSESQRAGLGQPCMTETQVGWEKPLPLHEIELWWCDEGQPRPRKCRLCYHGS